MYYRQALDCSLILKKEINWNNELVSSKKSDGALIESQGGAHWTKLGTMLVCVVWPVARINAGDLEPVLSS